MSEEVASWLMTEPLAARAGLSECMNRVRTWWRESTDVVLLNSPWLRRSTGRAMRCIMIGINLVQWLIALLSSDKDDALPDLLASHYLQLELLITLICFLWVIWVSTMRSRDGFWTGVALSIGLALSLRCYSCVFFGQGSSFDDLIFTFVALCHSNMHPVALGLFLSYTTTMFVTDFLLGPEVLDIDWSLWTTYLQGVMYYCIITVWLLLCAYTLDFSSRIKAVSSGILYGQNDSALESPVAGRTGRVPCWFAVATSWVCWFLYLCDSMHVSGAQRAWSCALLVPALGLSVLARCFPAKADIIMALLCHAPLILLELDLCVLSQNMLHYYHAALAGMGYDDVHAAIVGTKASMMLLYYCHLACILASQTLIQAGCHPFVCMSFAAFLVVQALRQVAAIPGSFDYDETSQLMYWLNPPFLCTVFNVSHCVDYFARMRAIHEGLRQSEANALSTHQLSRGLGASKLVELPEIELELEPTRRGTASLAAYAEPDAVPNSPRASELGWQQP